MPYFVKEIYDVGYVPADQNDEGGTESESNNVA